MYALTAGVTAFNFLLRQGIPQMIPFISGEMNFSAAQNALLLAGFFPGYMVTQIPGGWAAQIFGARVLNFINLAGQTVCLALLPTCASLGAVPLAAVFTCLGLCQGPLVPAQAVLQRHWMPLGGERAWASRMTQIGQRVGKIATTSITPWLAAARGWRTLIYVYCVGTGLFAALFGLLSTNKPRQWNGVLRPRMNGAELALLEAGVGGAKGKGAAESRGFPWYLFRVSASNVIILSHIAANATEYTLTQWAPTFFMEKHGVSAANLGAFLTIPQSVAFAATFVTAALENLVLKAGVPLLTVRRAANLGASALHLLFLLLFGLGRTPQQSMLAYCGVTATQCVYGSGHIPNCEPDPPLSCIPQSRLLSRRGCLAIRYGSLRRGRGRGEGRGEHRGELPGGCHPRAGCVAAPALQRVLDAAVRPDRWLPAALGYPVRTLCQCEAGG